MTYPRRILSREQTLTLSKLWRLGGIARLETFLDEPRRKGPQDPVNAIYGHQIRSLYSLKDKGMVTIEYGLVSITDKAMALYGWK